MGQGPSQPHPSNQREKDWFVTWLLKMLLIRYTNCETEIYLFQYNVKTAHFSKDRKLKPTTIHIQGIRVLPGLTSWKEMCFKPSVPRERPVLVHQQFTYITCSPSSAGRGRRIQQIPPLCRLITSSLLRPGTATPPRQMTDVWSKGRMPDGGRKDYKGSVAPGWEFFISEIGHHLLLPLSSSKIPL